MAQQEDSPPAADSTTADSLAVRRRLERRFAECELVRRPRRTRHEPGDRLDYRVTGVAPARRGRLVAEVERFVGGGFAGQVYRVRLLESVPEDGGGPLAGLEPGRHYAIKILLPPSGFARRFRNALYFAGFQCPFSAQVLPQAMRTGVLWQKLIRRAAAIRLVIPRRSATPTPPFSTSGSGRMVPVFGERGALVEHAVFDLFFNLPITVARGLRMRPLRWAAGIAAVTLAAAALVLALVARAWEWRQPGVELAGVELTAVERFTERGGDLGWTRVGVRVRVAELDAPVEFTSGRWESGASAGDRVDLQVRRRLLDRRWDGLALSRSR